MIFMFILLTLMGLINSIYGEKTEIRILIKQSDMSGIILSEEWENDYRSLMNAYITEKSKDNPILKDVDLLIDFYNYNNATCVYCQEYDDATDYTIYEENVIEGLRLDMYDMMVIDDRILYNDIALLETDRIEFFLYIKTFP